MSYCNVIAESTVTLTKRILLQIKVETRRGKRASEILKALEEAASESILGHSTIKCFEPELKRQSRVWHPKTCKIPPKSELSKDDDD